MKEHEQQVYEEKVRSLINISHELRTPLTLVHAPLRAFKQYTGETPTQYKEKAEAGKEKRVIRATREITIFKAQITQISQLFYDNYHSKNREIRATRA